MHGRGGLDGCCAGGGLGGRLALSRRRAGPRACGCGCACHGVFEGARWPFRGPPAPPCRGRQRRGRAHPSSPVRYSGCRRPWQATRTSSRGGGRARRRTAQHCTPPATPGRGMSRSRNQPPMPNTARSAGVKWGEEDQGLKFARSDCQRMSYAHSRNGGGVAHPQRQLGQDETRSLVHKLGGNS